ncbi:hypothetical protein [Sorangium sp. So ce131]|uniref:hypothetical protein n=1 Tax=Sorangium sp. So ce131 TaxID=3133282 RepID=UPI003F60696C
MIIAIAAASCSGEGAGHAGAGHSGGDGICARGPLVVAEWQDLGVVAADAVPRSVLVLGGQVLVGTTRGLFRRPLDDAAPWVPSGLDGLSVGSLHASPAAAGLVIAGLDVHQDGRRPSVPPIQRSTDGGHTWVPVGEALRDEAESTPEQPVYAPVQSLTSFVRSDGTEIFFGNASGQSVVRSEDGKRWVYVRGEPSSFGYPCYVHTPAGAEGFVYQGCEAPLDDAWIARFGVDEVPVVEPVARVVTREVLGNRRPNLLTSSPIAPGAVFAGVEGGLLRLTAEGSTWLYRAEQGDDPMQHGYVYVRSLWLDPCNAGHLVFGGGLNAPNEVMQLYESFDAGAHATRVDAPGLIQSRDIDIQAGATSEQGESLVLALSLDKVRTHVLVRKHRAATTGRGP